MPVYLLYLPQSFGSLCYSACGGYGRNERPCLPPRVGGEPRSLGDQKRGQRSSGHDYQARVAEGLDVAWLREKNILWVMNPTKGPALPREELEAYYRKMFETPAGSVWRMQGGTGT